MTYDTTTLKDQYDGNDSTTVFPYTFKIISNDQIEVVLTDSDGTTTTLVLDTDYTVSGAGDAGGGNVTYPVSGDPLATGEMLTLLKTVNFKQETDLHNQGGYFPETVEEALDYLIMCIQVLEERIDRAPKLAVDSTESATDDLDTDNIAAQVTACQTARDEAEAAAEAAAGQFKYAPYNIKTDDYTLVAADRTKINTMNNASAKAFTMPVIVEGHAYFIKNIGAGTLTITPAGAETTEVSTLAQNEAVLLGGDAANTKWRLIADFRNTFTSPTINTSVTGSAFLDEDDMASDSATKFCSQQSIKAYADTKSAIAADGSTVFNTTMTAASTFQDLDLSSYVGTNTALVSLEVFANATPNFVAKTKGYGDSTYTNQYNVTGNAFGSQTAHWDGANKYAYISVMTDASGVIQIGANDNTTTFTIKLIGYIA